MEQIVHPIPPSTVLESSELELVKKKIKDLEIECISVESRSKTAVKSAPFFMPTFCFEGDTTRLLVSYDHGIQVTQRERLGKFQGRMVPTQIGISLGGVNAVSAKIETLEAKTLTDGEIEPMDGVVKVAEITPLENRTGVGPGWGVTAGAPISQRAPIYPLAAKAAHESGMVLIWAAIGKDGHVRTTELIYAPYKDLGKAALDAVGRWTYQPYLLNNEPVELTTMVQVNFNIDVH